MSRCRIRKSKAWRIHPTRSRKPATGPAKLNSSVSLLSIDGVTSTSDDTKTNMYKFWNIEHMYTKGPAKPLAQALIDYMTNSDAKTIAASQDFIAITDMFPNAMSAHNAVS